MVKITEEIKDLIYDLNEQNVSTKEIANRLNISQSSVYNALQEGDKEQVEIEEDGKNEFIEKKLLEIFTYEKYIEESKLDLLYNLRKIAKNSGSIDLGEFLADIMTIFNTYYRYTDNTIKLFYFLLDLSNNLGLITNHIDPKILIEHIDNFYDREISMENAENYIACCDELLEETWEKWRAKILIATNEYHEIVNGRKEHKSKLIKRLRETNDEQQAQINRLKETIETFEQKVREALAKNIILSTFSKESIKNDEIQKTQIKKLTAEIQELEKLLEKLDKERGILEKAVRKMGTIFPEEVKTIVREITNEVL